MIYPNYALAASSSSVISSDFMGMTINGPVEAALVWPPWKPTTFRILDQFDTATGGFIPTWPGIETANGTYVWTTFDPIAAKYVAQNVANVVWGFEGVPQWAEVGNAYSFSCTIAASTGVVTATGNNFFNGAFVFFTGGTTGPFTAGTDYYVVNYAGNTFQLSATFGGTAITGGPSGSSTITMEQTPPSSASMLTNFINSYLTRAALDNFPIQYIEGPNEPNSVASPTSQPGWQGSIADAVTLQSTIYSAVQAWNAAHGTAIKVSAPPVSNALSFASGQWAYNFLTSGGGAYCDIIGYHAYPSNSVTDPENLVFDIASIYAAMVAGGVSLSKPIWITEYDAGSGATIGQNTTFAAVTSIMAAGLGLGRQYWYAYDNNGGFGQMWTSGGGLNATGTAWQQLVKWLIGATVTSTVYGISLSTVTIPGSAGSNLTFTTLLPMNLPVGLGMLVANVADTAVGLGTVVSNVGLTLVINLTNAAVPGTSSQWGIEPDTVQSYVNFSRPGGYQAQAVWTNDGSTPTYTVPAFAKQYHDLAGNLTTGIGATVTIGRNPILLENFSAF